MFELKSGPKPTRLGLVSLLRMLPVGDQFAVLPQGDNPRSRRATLYLTARRLGIRITVHADGKVFKVWRLS